MSTNVYKQTYHRKKLVENKTVRLEIQKYEYEMRKTEFKTILIIDKREHCDDSTICSFSYKGNLIGNSFLNVTFKH